MKKDTITTILGLGFAISFYLALFLAIEPEGNWGVSLTFASLVGAVYAFSKDWGDDEEVDENS